jgi:sialic acid synthase SpsE
MRIGSFDTEKEVLVIAEAGNNHEGDAGRAEELVRAAARAGAGAIKFQTFKTERFVSRADEARFRRLKSFELSPPVFEKLARLAGQEGLLFISTPLDLGSADFLAGIVDAFKIASGDNDFHPMMDRVAAHGKPVILSGGLATVAELRAAKRRIERGLRRARSKAEVAVLHCVTSYPVPDGQANLRAIPALSEALGGTVGYSDHTLGIDAAAAAAALGARVIEKHFTLDKKQSDFRDHQLSADPAELAELVRRVRRVGSLLGSGRKELQPCEKPFLSVVRRGAVARRALPAGAKLGADDVLWIRPPAGLPLGQERRLLGRRTVRPVAEGEPLTKELLK